MKRTSIGLAGLMCVMSIFHLVRAQENVTDELQQLQHKIGNDLIKMKKEHPATEELVYSLLDQFSKYSGMSKRLAEKINEYENQLRAERSKSELLKNELVLFKGKVDDMKRTMVDASKKMKEDSEQMSKILKQQEALETEKEALAKEKQKFEHEKQALLSAKDTLLKNREELVQEKEMIIGEKIDDLINKKQEKAEVKNSLSQKARKRGLTQDATV